MKFWEMILEWLGWKKEPKPDPEPTGCEWAHYGRKSLMVKPHAHDDGNLVILLPASYCPNDIAKVYVGDSLSYKVYKTTDPKKIKYMPDGKKYGPNENATHCRFKLPGENYGTTSLRVVMKDGTEKSKVFNMGVKKSYDF